MPLWSRGRQRDDDEVTALRRELDKYQQENMRLRLERQRPLSLGKLAHELRELHGEADDPVVPSPSDTVDEAYHVLAQAETTRRAVLDAVDGLTVAAAQLRRQLTADIPLSEIDRRVTERRGVRPVESSHEYQSVENSSHEQGTDAVVRLAPVPDFSEPILDDVLASEVALLGPAEEIPTAVGLGWR